MILVEKIPVIPIPLLVVHPQLQIDLHEESMKPSRSIYNLYVEEKQEFITAQFLGTESSIPS